MRDFYELTERGRARRLRVLALKALAEYDLDVKRVSLITNDTNGIFRVDTADGEKYALRVSLPTGYAAVQSRAEVMWLEALHRDTDLVVPFPVPTREGTYTTTVSVEGVPEPRVCMVMSWIPGRTLDRQLTVQNVRALGSLAARLHQHAAGFEPPEGFATVNCYDRIFPFDEPVILFDGAEAGLLPPARRELFEQVTARIQSAIDRLKTSGEPMRILHGDLHGWNVNLWRGHIGVFDFEDLLWGWPVQDIGITLYYFQGQPEYAALKAAFEQGYQEVAPWPERVSGEIDTFIAGRSIVLCNGILSDTSPEWRALTPEFFSRAERRLRALLAGDDGFVLQGW